MMLTSPLDDVDEDEAFERFADIGYESKFAVTNLDALFIFFLLLLVVPTVTLLLIKPCKNRYQYLLQKHISISNSLRGNMFFRYILEACLDITICIFIQMHYMNNDWLNFDSTYRTVNSVITIILGIAVLLFPAFLLIFYCKTFSRWEDE